MFQRLVAAIWLGSAFFLMLAASAAFRAAPNQTVAGDVVGAMLTRWHYIALAAPLLLFAVEFRNARGWVLSLLFAGLMLAAAQGFVDLRIREMRLSSDISISDLRPSHPLRRRFGALHGTSMMLLALQVLVATLAVAAGPKPETRAVPAPAQTSRTAPPPGPEGVSTGVGAEGEGERAAEQPDAPAEPPPAREEPPSTPA